MKINRKTVRCLRTAALAGHNAVELLRFLIEAEQLDSSEESRWTASFYFGLAFGFEISVHKTIGASEFFDGSNWSDSELVGFFDPHLQNWKQHWHTERKRMADQWRGND